MMGNQEQGQWTQDSLRELAAKKEEEWKQVQQLRAESAEKALTQREKEHQELKSKFVKLKEDFKYNLRLLGERDTELDRYDSVFNDLKGQLSKKDMEMSDLKITVDNLKTALAQEQKARDELQLHYQHRVREKHTEMEKYRHSKDAEIQKERQELETFKRNLERQLRELEEELDLQRKELTAGFEDAMRKREHEFRVQADEMSSTVLAHEMKAKLVTKELELLKAAQSNTAQEFEQVEGNHRQLEKQLKQKDWELEDLKAMKDAKITELQGNLQHLESSKKKTEDEYQRKYAELDRYAKEKEATISKLRTSADEKQHHLQEEIRSAQSHLEGLQIKVRQAEWNVQDAHKEKESLREKLETELADMKSRWDLHISEMSKNNVQRDVEYEALRENDTKLKAELSQRKDDIERYKRELNLAMEREAGLQRSNAQLELDWQKRYDSVERHQYEKAEDLVKNLTEARDQALAELKERKRELEHCENLVKLLTKEREQAFRVLKQHGLRIDPDINSNRGQHLPGSATDDMTRLEEQNENLRHVVRQMRQEMESLGDSTVGSNSARSGRGTALVANEYVRNLEEELHKLKAENRKLKHQVVDDTEGSKVDPQDLNRVTDAAGDNTFVKAHVEQLNTAIGALRGEKVDLTAQLRKQQTRLHHLEGALDKALKQPKDFQVQVEQLQYEVNAQARRHAAEVSSLKSRNGELELHLAEARKEADEYHRANVERNLDVTNLTNQLSQLKMNMAQDRPTVNFGAQELMIQQLQDEIQHLRQLQKGEESIGSLTSFDPKLGQGQGLTTNAMVAQLQQKLKTAAKHITQLAKEKQQLIEMGNRLRAELKNNGLQPSLVSKPASKLEDSGSSVLQEKINNKLQQLEKLQYELTKQELAKNQTRARGDGDPHTKVPMIQLQSTTDEDEEEEWNYKPQSILKKSSGGSSWGAPSSKLSPVPEDVVPSRRPRSAPDKHTHLDSISMRMSARSSEGMPTNRTSSPLRENPTAGLLASVSSVGGESLQEIWRMLDEDGSPRPFTPMGTGEMTASGPFNGLQFPGDEISQRPKSADSWTIKGQRPALEQKPKAQTKNMSDKVIGKVSVKKSQPKTRIRNWNVTDDNSKR